MGALSEVELVCITNKAFSTVGISSNCLEPSFVCSTANPYMKYRNGYSESQVDWECSLSQTKSAYSKEECKDFVVTGSVRFSKKCCGVAWITAEYINQKDEISIVNFDKVIDTMADKMYGAARKIGLSCDDILHVRMYYNQEYVNDNGEQIRTTLRRALNKCGAASTVIPVVLVKGNLFSLQVIICNLEQMETEMWVDKDRVYN